MRTLAPPGLAIVASSNQIEQHEGGDEQRNSAIDNDD
jgi:hypothetical protein